MNEAIIRSNYFTCYPLEGQVKLLGQKTFLNKFCTIANY